MTRYYYAAVERSGKKHHAELEAETESAVLSELSAKGLTPLIIKPVSGGLWQRLNQPLDLGASLSGVQLAAVTQELSVLLSANLDVDEALRIACDQAQSPKIERFLEAVLGRVKEGWALSKALSENAAIPAFYSGIVASAEAGGDLSRAFADLAGYLERSQEVAQKIKAALVYPIIVLGMVLASLIVVLTLVIPKFEPVFQGVEDQLPLLTQIVLFASRVFNANLWLFAALAALFVFACILVWMNPRLRQRGDRMLLHHGFLAPILYQNAAAKVLRVLGTSLRNGVPLVAALELSANAAGNRYLDVRIHHVAGQVRQGRGFSEALGQEVKFPKVALNLARVGESSSQLPAMLLKAAQMMETSSRNRLDRFIALLNPLATIGLGGIVAALVAGVMLGILSLSQIAI